jgi:hypothetical protein
MPPRASRPAPRLFALAVGIASALVGCGGGSSGHHEPPPQPPVVQLSELYFSSPWNAEVTQHHHGDGTITSDVSWTIANDPYGWTEDVPWLLLCDGVPLASGVVTALPPGFEVVLAVYDIVEAPGDHTYLLLIDPDDAIPEYDESNNELYLDTFSMPSAAG